MLGLASCGISEQDYFINQFHINEMTVPDLSLLKYLLIERNKESNYVNKSIVEVGLPFKNYPIFKDLEIPWIVATPTLFSFTSEFEKNIFLKDILGFINKNARNDIVYYKPHNGSEDDYFKVKKFLFFQYLFTKIPFLCIIFSLISNILSYKSNLFYRVYNLLLHNKLISKTKSFDNIKECSYMALESYMNCIKFAIIGGFKSNMGCKVLWYTIHKLRRFKS